MARTWGNTQSAWRPPTKLFTQASIGDKGMPSPTVYPVVSNPGQTEPKKEKLLKDQMVYTVDSKKPESTQPKTFPWLLIGGLLGLVILARR